MVIKECMEDGVIVKGEGEKKILRPEPMNEPSNATPSILGHYLFVYTFGFFS
jgi:hypothetical protein